MSSKKPKVTEGQQSLLKEGQKHLVFRKNGKVETSDPRRPTPNFVAVQGDPLAASRFRL